MPKTLEKYQKCSFAGPETALQNRENEVRCSFPLVQIADKFVVHICIASLDIYSRKHYSTLITLLLRSHVI
jgi:hypothetical protein